MTYDIHGSCPTNAVTAKDTSRLSGAGSAGAPHNFSHSLLKFIFSEFINSKLIYSKLKCRRRERGWARVKIR